MTELLGDIPFHSRVEGNWGRPDDWLAVMPDAKKADLIVVGSHQYSGFDRLWHTSVSRTLLHSARMSVAVIPLSGREKRGVSLARQVRRVLVATDFSDLGTLAIAHAYSLVHGGGTVLLVHVIHPHERPMGHYLQGHVDQHVETQQTNQVQISVNKLRALIPLEAAANGILSEVEVVEHTAAGAGICQAAEKFGAEVVCLGSHGHSGWLAGILGSVTQKVISINRRPLLIVQPPVE